MARSSVRTALCCASILWLLAGPAMAQGVARAAYSDYPAKPVRMIVPLAPELPTIAEAGVPGFEYATWYGMLVPAGTPGPIVERIQGDTAKSIRAPQVRERFSGQGLEVYGNSPAEFQAYLGTELVKWDKLVRAAAVRVD